MRQEKENYIEEKEESAVAVIGRLAGRLILTALAVLVLFLASGYAYNFGKSIFYQEPLEEAPGTDVSLELEEGADYAELARILREKGVISNELALTVQASLYKTLLEPGSYTVNTSMTTKEILTAISERASELEEERKRAESKEQPADVLDAGDEAGTRESRQDEDG